MSMIVGPWNFMIDDSGTKQLKNVLFLIVTVSSFGLNEPSSCTPPTQAIRAKALRARTVGVVEQVALDVNRDVWQVVVAEVEQRARQLKLVDQVRFERVVEEHDVVLRHLQQKHRRRVHGEGHRIAYHLHDH